MNKFKKALLLSIILFVCYMIIPIAIFGWHTIQTEIIQNLSRIFIIWVLSFAQSFIIIDFLEEFN